MNILTAVTFYFLLSNLSKILHVAFSIHYSTFDLYLGVKEHTKHCQVHSTSCDLCSSAKFE